MRKNIIWIAIILFAVTVQATWLEAIRIRGVVPDIMLLLIVYFALNDGEERAMWTGAIGGVFEDVAADTALGHHVLCNVIVGYVIGRVGQRLVIDHPAVKVGMVFLAALGHGILFTFVAYVQQPELGVFYPILANVVPTAFYTAITTPVVFFVLDRSRKRYVPVQKGLS